MVGPATISSLPATLSRSQPAIPIIHEVNASHDQESTNPGQETNTDHNSTKDSSVETSPEIGETNDPTNGDIVKDTAGETDSAGSMQLVPVSYFRPRFFRHTQDQVATSASLTLPAAVFEPVTWTPTVGPNTCIPEWATQSATSISEPLNSETGALVPYRHHPRSFRPVRLVQAVWDLSESLEDTQPGHCPDFDEGKAITYYVSEETTSSPTTSPSMTQTANFSSRKQLKQIQSASSSSSTTADADARVAREIHLLRTAHRAELEKLNQSHREDLEIYANDLQEEMENAKKAKKRTGEVLKQLTASRKERRQLNGVQARNSQLEAELIEEKRRNQCLVDAGLALQASLDKADDDYKALQADRDRIWRLYQNLQQQSVEQDDIIENLRDNFGALTHQMNLAVGEKAAAQAGILHLQETLKKKDGIKRALLNKRADLYVETPLGTENPAQLCPDQLRDAEKALQTSQAEHQKASERAGTLAVQLKTKSDALEDTMEYAKGLEKDYRDLRQALGRLANLDSTNSTMLKLMADHDLPQESHELFNAAIMAEDVKKTLSQQIKDGIRENYKLRESLRKQEAETTKIVNDYEQKLRVVTTENERLENESLGQAIEIRDLKKIAVLYRHAGADNRSMLEGINTLRTQLATRAFGRDETLLWNEANHQLADALFQVQQLENVVYDQQIVLEKKDEEISFIKCEQQRRFGYPLSLLLARDRYYTIVKAFLNRFREQLASEGPLIVDVTSCVLLLNDEEVQEFMQFPEHVISSREGDLGNNVASPPDNRIWMKVVYDQERLQGAPSAANIDHEAVKRMMSAVEAEAWKAGERDLDEARSAQKAEDGRRKGDEDFWDAYKQQQNADHDKNREQIRQEAVAANREVATVLDLVRKRPDWDKIEPALADADDEEWETVSPRGQYLQDYGQSEEPSTTLVNEEQPNNFQVPSTEVSRNEVDWERDVF